MNQEIHSTNSGQASNCQNCKTDFIIEPDDFAFYAKLNVPAPTWCWECRSMRRMTWRNERALYRRKCAATGKDVITIFAPEQPLVVYERNYWWSDTWDQLASGRDYDFSKPFFQQYRELLERAPLPNVFNFNAVNSDYGNHNLDVKNCYLVFASYKAEDMSYSGGVIGCKSSLDISKALNLTQCYDDVLCGDMNRVSFSYDSDESTDSAFLHACKNVNSSLGCINLRSKSYAIFNQPYSKEEYAIERAKYDLGSYRSLEDFRKKFDEFISKHPRRHGFIYKCQNAIGDNLINVKNVYMGFDIFGDGNVAEDCKYVIHGSGLRDTYDAYGAGDNISNGYEIVDTGNDSANVSFAVFAYASQNTRYTYACQGLKDSFGCVGLRSKQYCILNKQYTKEEYEVLLPKVIEHMNAMPYVDSKGREYKYGEFFPIDLSPFAYNETIAQEYYSKIKAEIQNTGYRWRDPDVKQYAITKKAQDLPDHIKDVTEDILKDVIECEHANTCNEQCMGAFKIIPSELQFYQSMNLPLPRLCSNCRHYRRLRRRTPFKLWDRSCNCGGQKSQDGIYVNTVKHSHGDALCQNQFKSSYAPEGKEIVYCEQCYKEEVF